MMVPVVPVPSWLPEAGLSGGLVVLVAYVVVNELAKRDLKLTTVIAGKFKRILSVFVHVNVRFERRKD
jgi:hypothetical protein